MATKKNEAEIPLRCQCGNRDSETIHLPLCSAECGERMALDLPVELPAPVAVGYGIFAGTFPGVVVDVHTGQVELYSYLAEAHEAAKRAGETFLPRRVALFLTGGCELDTDGDGNCPVHPTGCPAPDSTLAKAIKERRALVELLAKMVAGLAAPYSVDRRALGAAGEPWAAIRERLKLVGYSTAIEIEQALRKELGL